MINHIKQLLQRKNLLRRFIYSSSSSHSLPIIHVYVSDQFESSNNSHNFTFGNPCILKGLTTVWPAHHNWSKQQFIEKYGDGIFEFGVDEDDKYISMTARDFLTREMITNPALYMFDKTFDISCPSLFHDYSIPRIFRSSNTSVLNEEMKWLLIGEAGSGSWLHADPAGTSAWNALVIGRKEWIIVSPLSHDIDAAFIDELNREHNLRQDINAHFDNILSCLCKSSSMQKQNREVYQFAQLAGEVVYIPAGWLHAVRNLEYTAAVTHNFLENELVSGISMD